MTQSSPTAESPRFAPQTVVRLLMALFLITGAAAAADTPKSAAKDFRDAWKRGIPASIRYTMQDLTAFDSPVCVDVLLDVFRTGERAFFPQARRVLAGYASLESVALLVREGVGHRSPVVRAQAIRALGEGRPTSFGWVGPATDALHDPVADVRAAAVSALGRARAVEAMDLIIDLASDPSERVRMAVPEALARLAGGRALPVLRSLADDKRWRVRLGVVNALSDIKTHKSIEALIDQLEQEQGRLREDCIARLQRLTGRAFGLDLERWRSFIADPPDDFMLQADRAALRPPQYAGGVRYYGVKTLSKRFVMVTDVSGSMQTPVAVSSQYGNELARIDITKGELDRLIEALDDDVSFNLVKFSGESRPWNSTLVPANARNKRNARAVVKKYRADGATNVYDALTFVFDMAEEALDAPISKSEDVDTVFLLSDGVPTEGMIQTIDLLQEYIAERNAVLQLRIHCLSLTSDVQAANFLERVSDISGGRYVMLVNR